MMRTGMDEPWTDCGQDCSLWTWGKEVGMRDGGWKRDGPCSETREINANARINESDVG
ncbi:hypothetical protein BGZ61DRAFT_440268 [Ilyonectria robusta]|uniref:uncharacterized protein n=1 Tax=Ilyonectria robusta TaxID=1079257 RepID=UPI001E8EB888|nr:uncharacterized protein BGZ61DRAFT_440268 [Ilyonectria robusta]KAH8735452.1 hypothetical protein BGZ61DRAFT_440268 [Ilyonectria robusta]